MTLMNKFLVGSSTVIFALMLACGGGGGSTPPTPPTPPAITTQPASQTVNAGSAATFSVVATGSALSYQWSKNSVAISGATAAQVNTGATVAGDNGASYTVTISNAGGSVTSTPAILTVQTPATTLTYTDPTTGTYKLVKNVAGSTASHLVLDLIGPSTGTAQGVSLTLSADAAKVTWVDVATGSTPLVTNVAFTLGSGTPILKGKVTGDVLQATIAQKAPTAPFALNGTSLLRVALDLKTSVVKGSTITFTADATKCQVLADTASVPTTIPVTVGTLTAQ